MVMMCTYENRIACHVLVGPFLIHFFAIYGGVVARVVKRNLMLRPYYHVSAGGFGIGLRVLAAAGCCWED